MASKEALALLGLPSLFRPWPWAFVCTEQQPPLLLAGPPDPRCCQACPVSAVNLAARRPKSGAGRGQRAGPGRAGRSAPGVGWGGGGESRGGWGEGQGAESRRWGHWCWLRVEAGREGKEAVGAAQRKPLELRSRGNSGGRGQGFPGFGKAATGLIFRRSPEFVMIVAAAAVTAPVAISSSSSSWAGRIPSPLPPPLGLGPCCLLPWRSRSCSRLLIHPRAT